MSAIFFIHDLSAVLVVRNQNPTLLNLDFLKYSGIVPQDWELTNPPVSTPQGSQVIFQNGLKLIADSNRTLFIESIASKSYSEVKFAEIAKLYTQALPRAEYEALGINLVGYATFPDNPELAQHYLTKTLLSHGTWLEFGNSVPKVDLNISYSLEQGNLNLKVGQAVLKKDHEAITTPIVTYSGNFEYSLQQLAPADKLGFLYNLLDQWQAHVETFTNLIERSFLNI
jgi:hypothetical protein